MGACTLSSMALNDGLPTALFVVFKSSKLIMVTVVSVTCLGVRVKYQQWAGLLIVCVGMLLASQAEKKGTPPKKTKGVAGAENDDGSDAASALLLLALGLLITAELCHAAQIVMQEVLAKRFAFDPAVIVGGASIAGFISTVLAMWKLQGDMVPCFPAGKEPASEKTSYGAST